MAIASTIIVGCIRIWIVCTLSYHECEPRSEFAIASRGLCYEACDVDIFFYWLFKVFV